MKSFYNLLINNYQLILFYIFIIIVLLIQVKQVEKHDAEISRQKQQNYYIKEVERNE